MMLGVLNSLEVVCDSYATDPISFTSNISKYVFVIFSTT